MAKKRGYFIVLEGIDRVGKSTQARLLYESLKLEGEDVVLRAFPDRVTSVGRTIDAYLKGQTEINKQALHLLFTANRWEAQSGIKATLASGTSIVCDRYVASGLAYSLAKGIPLDWSLGMEKGLVAPDLVIHYELNPADAVARQVDPSARERHDTLEFQGQVAQAFTQIHQSCWAQRPWRTLSLTTSQTPEDVLKATRAIISDAFSQHDPRTLPLSFI